MPLVDGRFLPLQLPAKHKKVLLDRSRPWRYRVLYGGRNGAKDWSVTGVLAEMGVRTSIRVLFTREVQKSIRDSVYQLLVDTINRLGLAGYYDIQANEIKGLQNGTKFLFTGLKDLTVDNLKSYEGVDIVVIGEAQGLTEKSFKVLNPTIRKPGSEIWILYNPQSESDYVYKITVLEPLPLMISAEVCYKDLPRGWLSDEVLNQAKHMQATQPAEYEHIWMGRPRDVGALVLPTFDERVHVREWPVKALRSANFFMGMDPHLHYYPACVWLARIPKGDDKYDYWVYNEWPMRSTFGGTLYHELRHERKCTITLSKRAGIFRTLDNTLEKVHGFIKIRARGIDTRFAKGSGGESHTTQTRGIIAEMAEPANGGLTFVTPPEVRIDAARNALRELSDYDPLLELSLFNEPCLYVAPWCANVIDSCKHHRFDRDNREREDEMRKDFWDALKIAIATAEMCPHEMPFVKSKVEVVVDDDNYNKLQKLYMKV